jgi:hypothetical protein
MSQVFATAPPLLLTADELVELTGYRQHRRQIQWLADRLKIKPPTRPDGLPIISRAQFEAALAGKTAPVSNINWD